MLKKICGLLIIFLLAPLAGYSAAIAFYIGDVSLIRNGKSISFDMGENLTSGDIIKTGGGGSADIQYPDGSMIKLSERSSIRIGSANIKNSDSVSLIYGNLSVSFKKIAKGQNKVYTPTTVAAIRGTEFTVAVSKGGDSRVDLKEGNLDVSNPYGTTNVTPGKNVHSGVGEKPDTDAGGSPDEWKTKRNEDLKKNPGDKAKRYSRYVKKFRERSDDSEKNIGACRKKVKQSKDPSSIQKTGTEIDMEEEKIQDDLLLNENSSNAIQEIADDFRSNKDNIYDEFERVKRESNKVLEVQKKAYEDIEAVKEEYRKAYEEIMGKFKDDKKKILEGVKIDMPVIKKEKVDIDK